MADYPLKQEAAEVQEILDGAFLSNKGQVFSEETKAFMREKIGASATGEGLKILSHFDTLEQLQLAVPNPTAGDAFSVGTDLPYNLYIFDFYNGVWRNYGPIRANDIKARFAQNISVPASAWEEDENVFVDFTFKAPIPLAEVTGNDFPIIAFAPSDAVSGNYCPISYAFDGRLEIWARTKPTETINIPAATFIVQDVADTVTGNNTKGITNASGGIATGGIGTEQIANGAITRAKLSKNAVSRVFEVAIGTNWAGSAAPYTQEIAVEGLPDSNRIFAGLDFSDDWETAVKEDEELNKIVKITAANGNMKVYAEEPTTVQLNVKITVFTGQGTGGDDDGEGGGSGGSSSGGGVQADWNQTDETAPDFIKNKPFGDEETVLFAEQTVYFDNGIGAMATSGMPAIGDNVTIQWDGTTYISQVQDYAGYPAVGDMGLFDGVVITGEPFFGLWMDSNYLEMYANAETAVVEISGKLIIKLPRKYYNTMRQLYSDGVYIYHDGTLSTKMTAHELSSLLTTTTLSVVYAGVFSIVVGGHITSGVGSCQVLIDGKAYTMYTAEYVPEG